VDKGCLLKSTVAKNSLILLVISYGLTNLKTEKELGNSEMGGSCSKYLGEKRWIHGFGGETGNQTERDNLETQA
jgi:hypothetical protein